MALYWYYELYRATHIRPISTVASWWDAVSSVFKVRFIVLIIVCLLISIT